MGRGEDTRAAIVTHALQVAATDGLDSLTIGRLSAALGMSKSGLFAHFKSKEQLQLQVLQHAVDRFVTAVVAPAIKEPRGLARVRALYDYWLDFAKQQPGGCIIHSASSELDDKPGMLRDFLEEAHRDLRETVERAARISIEEGHFRADLDVRLFAFQFASYALGYQQAARLLRDESAIDCARASFEELLERASAG